MHEHLYHDTEQEHLDAIEAEQAQYEYFARDITADCSACCRSQQGTLETLVQHGWQFGMVSTFCPSHATPSPWKRRLTAIREIEGQLHVNKMGRAA